MQGKKYKFLISAGGTGGHILPGLSIYYQLKKDDHEIKFVCRKKDLEFIEELNYIKNDLVFFPGIGLSRKWSLRNLLFLYYLLIGFFKSLILFITFFPDAVIGMGGYITFPLLSMSFIFRVPCFLCEQNSYPGRVNLIFGSYARLVFINFKYSEKFFKNSQLTGNPIRAQLKEKIVLTQARKFFGFDNNKKVLLIMGGSQGALKINQIFENALPALNKFSIIWLTGKNHYEIYKKYEEKGRIKVFSYLKEMNYAYKSADLAISRAGAMSISELAYFGIPAIFIPLFHSAENHQLLNGQSVEQEGGGAVLEEKFLDEAVLLKKINEFFSSSMVLKKYKENIRKFYREESENKIVGAIIGKLERKN